MTDQEIKELQEEEIKIWNYLEKALSTFQKNKVARLIEINTVLEELSNR